MGARERKEGGITGEQIECSKGAACPIVAAEPEPDEVRSYLSAVGADGATLGGQERVWLASGRVAPEHLITARHPTREGAIRAFRAAVRANQAFRAAVRAKR